jgi:CO dehydrogenase maturation factor
MDMEPGIEHLGRATARGVTSFIVVVEPGTRSIESFKRISGMALQIGLRNISVIANRIKSQADEDLIRRELGAMKIIGVIPYSETILSNDRDCKSAIDNLDDNLLGLFTDIVQNLL